MNSTIKRWFSPRSSTRSKWRLDGPGLIHLKCSHQAAGLIIAGMTKGLLIAAMAALAAANALAADRVDVSRGEALARQWCKDCHVIDRRNRERLYDEVPTFSEIASLPSTTEVSLRAFLQTPHRRMPNFRLAPAEIDELVGYILDLKERR